MFRKKEQYSQADKELMQRLQGKTPATAKTASQGLTKSVPFTFVQQAQAEKQAKLAEAQRRQELLAQGKNPSEIARAILKEKEAARLSKLRGSPKPTKK